MLCVIIHSQEFPQHGAAGSDGCHRRVNTESGGSSASLCPLSSERTTRLDSGPLQSQPGQDRHIRSVLSCLLFSLLLQGVTTSSFFVVNHDAVASTHNAATVPAGTTGTYNSGQATVQNTGTVISLIAIQAQHMHKLRASLFLQL